MATPYTYAQIRELQARYGMEDMSSDAFAKMFGYIDGSQDYKAGEGNGLGKLFKVGNYALDQAIEGSGIPGGIQDLARSAGAQEDMAQALGSMPRAVVDMLPMMLATGGTSAVGQLGMKAAGIGGSALLAGSHAYAESDSPTAGVLGGLTMAALPFAASAGGKAALSLAEKMGLDTSVSAMLNVSPHIAQAITGGAGEVGANGLTQLMAGGALRSPGARVAEFLGHEAGMFGGMTASSAITNAAMAESGHRWEAAMQAFDPRSLFVNAATQLPFTLVGGVKLGQAHPDNAFVREHGAATEAALANVGGPPLYGERGQQYNIAMPTAEPRYNQYGLVEAPFASAPEAKLYSDMVQGQLVAQGTREENGQVIGTFRPQGMETPAPVDLSRPAEVAAKPFRQYMGDAWHHYQKELNAADPALKGKSPLRLEEAKSRDLLEMLKSETVAHEAKLAVATHVTETPVEKVAAEVKQKLADGVAPADAVKEVQTGMNKRARRAAEKRADKAERKAQGEVTIKKSTLEAMDVVGKQDKVVGLLKGEAQKRSLTDAEQQTIADHKLMIDKAQAAETSSGKNSIYIAYAKHVAGDRPNIPLGKKLGAIVSHDKLAKRKVGTRQVVKSVGRDGKPVITEGSNERFGEGGKMSQEEATKLAARLTEQNVNGRKWEAFQNKGAKGETEPTFRVEGHVQDVVANGEFKQDFQTADDYINAGEESRVSTPEVDNAMGEHDIDVDSKKVDTLQPKELSEREAVEVAKEAVQEAREKGVFSEENMRELGALDPEIAYDIDNLELARKKVDASLSLIKTHPSKWAQAIKGWVAQNVFDSPADAQAFMRAYMKTSHAPDLGKMFYMNGSGGVSGNPAPVFQSVLGKEFDSGAMLGLRASKAGDIFVDALRSKFKALPKIEQEMVPGFEQWLEGRKTVTREEVQGWVKENEVKMEVHTYGQGEPFSFGQLSYMMTGTNGRHLAKTRQALRKALTMAESGKYTDEQIRQATGWKPGMYDGEWRFEISDDKMRKLDGWKNAKTLGELINHPELFKLYPMLKDAPFSFEDMGHDAGYISAGRMALSDRFLKGTIDGEKALDIIAHEIQHLVQDIENFASGGSYDTWYRMVEQMTGMKPPRTPANEDLAVKTYFRLAGEGESRNTAERRTMTEAERALVPEELTADLPAKRAIVSFHDTYVNSLDKALSHPLMDEGTSIREMAARFGMDRPEDLAQIKKLLAAWDGGDIKFIEGANGQAGFYAETTAGEKVIGLSADRHMGAIKWMYTLAHEYNGHGMWEAHKAGLLDGVDSGRLDRFETMVKGNTAEDNIAMLHSLWDMLPERFQKDMELKQEIERSARGEDAEIRAKEVIANANAIASLVLANAPKGRIGEWINMLPKPIADLLRTMAKWGRKMFGSVAGVERLRELGAVSSRTGFDAGRMEVLDNYLRVLTEVMKAERYEEQAVMQLERMQTLTEPGALLDLMNGQGRDMFLDVSYMNAPWLKKWGESLGLTNREGDNRMGDWWDKHVGLLSSLGTKFPAFRRMTTMYSRREMKLNAALATVYNMFGMKMGPDGRSYVGSKDTAMYKVSSDPRLGKVRDDLIRHVNKTDTGTLDSLVAGGDAEVQKILSAVTKGEREMILDDVRTGEKAQDVLTGLIEEFRNERALNTIGEIAMLNDRTMTSEQAREMAAKIYDAVGQGQVPSVGDVGLHKMARKMAMKIQADSKFWFSKPYFVNEQRMGDYKFSVMNPKDGTRKVIDARSPEEQARKMAEFKASDPTLRVEAVTSRDFQMKKDLLEGLIGRENELSDLLKEELLHAYPMMDADTVGTIVDRNNIVSNLRMEDAMETLGKESPKTRKMEVGGGREDLDMREQQLAYMSRVLQGLTKSVMDSEFKMLKRDPNVRDHDMMATVEQGYLNYKTPDPKWVRKIGELNYTMNLAFHFFNMVQDASQPLLGLLPANLVAEGAKFWEAQKLVAGAMKDMGAHLSGTKKLTGERLALFNWFKKGNASIGAYEATTAMHNTALEAIQNRRRASGLDEKNMLKDNVMKPAFWLQNKGKLLSKIFTDFGAQSALLAAYDFYIKQPGMTHVLAREKAFELQMQSQANAGRGGRAVTMWNNAAWRPVSAMVTGLQTYANNVIGTLKAHMQRGFFSFGEDSGPARKSLSNLLGRTGELAPHERAQARKAFVTGLGTLVGIAGILGVPGVGVMLKLMETLGWNANEDLHELFEDKNDPTQQSIALHGLGHLFGFDVGTKMGVQGILGMNSYSGFDPASIFGPTGGTLKNFGKGIVDLAHGDVGGALENAAPAFIKRPLKLWRDDFQFQDGDGTKMMEATGMQQAMYGIFGLKPTELSRMEEIRNMQKTDQVIERDKKTRWVQDTAGDLIAGDVEGAKEAIRKKQVEGMVDVEELVNSVAAQYVDRMVPFNPGLDRTLGSFGRSNADSVQRVQAATLVKQMLGVPGDRQKSERELSRARLIDQMLGQNPRMRVAEARSAVAAQHKQ